MNKPKELFDRAGCVPLFPLGKRPYLCPLTSVIDLGPMLDVCNNSSDPKGNTDPFGQVSGDGWEDEFNN